MLNLQTKVKFEKAKRIIFLATEVIVMIEAVIRIAIYRPGSNLELYLAFCLVQQLLVVSLLFVIAFTCLIHSEH